MQRVGTSLDCGGGKGEPFVVYAGDSPLSVVYNGECGSDDECCTADGPRDREPTAELLDAARLAVRPSALTGLDTALRPRAART